MCCVKTDTLTGVAMGHLWALKLKSVKLTQAAMMRTPFISCSNSVHLCVYVYLCAHPEVDAHSGDETPG